jgi:hypothetical protein
VHRKTLVKGAHEVTRHDLDVAFPFAQRRNFNRDGTEPVEEIFAEGALLNHRSQVPIGGGHHSNIHGYFRGAATCRNVEVSKTRSKLTCVA